MNFTPALNVTPAYDVTANVASNGTTWPITPAPHVYPYEVRRPNHYLPVVSVFTFYDILDFVIVG